MYLCINLHVQFQFACVCSIQRWQSWYFKSLVSYFSFLPAGAAATALSGFGVRFLYRGTGNVAQTIVGFEFG